MTGADLLTQGLVYLAAAVVAVPVAKRLGLGSVLGYLAAGALIGPFGLHLVGAERADVLHFAEFGVVLMLFLVGLELEPALLWRLRGSVFGLGGLQVALTAALVAAAAALAGLSWPAGVAVGLILALSSTAIALQSLDEKGRLKTEGGQRAFSVLLFQDIAVIPILALLPLLAPRGAAGEDTAAGAGAHGALAGQPGWVQALAVLGAVAAVVLAGRFLVRPLLRAAARTRLREMFTASSLLLVVGIAVLMREVGLSPALGTFLAGVVLANSEYRHELVADIEPFKGLLLGLFFIAVGASIDFGLVAARPGLLAALVAGVVLLKLLVLLGLGRAFGLAAAPAVLLAASLAQVGEFAFVLIGFAAQLGVLRPAVAGPLVAVVALTMALSPVVEIAADRLVLPRLGPRAAPAREPDPIDERNAVIVAGFGRFGQVVARLLRAQGVGTTVLESDADRIELLRRFGLRAYYGDASRLDLLHAAGAAHARLLVLALDDPQKRLELVRTARRHFPQLEIFARAEDIGDAHELLDAGVTRIYRETLDASLRLGADALHALGTRAYAAQRAARAFLRHDEASLRHLAPKRGDQAAYVSEARARIADLERQMRADEERHRAPQDAGWDPESLRDDARRGTFPVTPP